LNFLACLGKETAESITVSIDRKFAEEVRVVRRKKSQQSGERSSEGVELLRIQFFKSFEVDFNS